jgi:topoisomerase-4 subunit A
MKVPILLAQGTEGIAVSLACKILPHNFLELCDASIASAQNKPFTLLPDFPCGGLVDVTNYQDGKAGGKIKSRATIEIINKTKIEIKELAFGSTTTTLKESILEAVEKGKIKIKSIDDMTSSAVSLIIELHPGSDPEMITDALFAHTDCETVHHPIGVVVDGGKPVFLGVSDILKKTVERTKELLKKEMEVRLEEIAKRWMKLNLERIFIETKSYKVLEGCPTEEEGVDAITKSLTPHLKKQGLARNPSEEEIKALTSLPIRRISLYDMNAASREMLELEAEEKVLQSKIQHLTKTTIDYFKQLKKTYGTDKERKAEIHSGEFKTKRTTSEILPKHKTYWNKKDGFIGTGLKREEALAFETNEMTDVAAISSAGLLKFARIKEKTFFNEDLIWCDLAEVPTTEDPTKNRNKVISIVYSHPAEDPNAKTYAKRFQLGEGFVREKSYDICPPGSKILFLAAQPPGEIPPKIELKLKAKKRIKIKTTGVDFKEVLIKNRLAKGIVASPHACEAPKEH